MSNKNISGGNELLDAQDILENNLGLFYGASVADLGCGGSGYFVFQSARLVGQAGVVYAVDILKSVLKNIDNRAKMIGTENIKTVWSNLENYGATAINDASLDFVLLINVLFQNKQHGKIMRESSRLLKRDGKLLVVDWKNGRFPFGPPKEMKIEPEEINDLGLGAGLKKYKEFEAGRFHYGIIFEKI